MTTSFEPSEKGQSLTLRLNMYHMVKIWWKPVKHIRR